MTLKLSRTHLATMKDKRVQQYPRSMPVVNKAVANMHGGPTKDAKMQGGVACVEKLTDYKEAGPSDSMHSQFPSQPSRSLTVWLKVHFQVQLQPYEAGMLVWDASET